MFEAAVRILEEEGLAGLTTNRIAAVAGVSVGTLYQYFPDKQSLIAQLAQREVSRTFERLAASVEPAQPTGRQSLEVRVRTAVKILLSAFDGRTFARKALLMALVGTGQGHLLDEQIQRHALAFLTQRLPPARSTGMTPVQAFVLTRAVSAAIRGALTHEEQLLGRPEFEAAIEALILGFVERVRPNCRPAGTMAGRGKTLCSQMRSKQAKYSLE